MTPAERTAEWMDVPVARACALREQRKRDTLRRGRARIQYEVLMQEPPHGAPSPYDSGTTPRRPMAQ